MEIVVTSVDIYIAILVFVVVTLSYLGNNFIKNAAVCVGVVHYLYFVGVVIGGGIMRWWSYTYYVWLPVYISVGIIILVAVIPRWRRAWCKEICTVEEGVSDETSPSTPTTP